MIKQKKIKEIVPEVKHDVIKDLVESMKFSGEGRDPARIKAFCAQLQAVWLAQPDTRFWQLLRNLSGRGFIYLSHSTIPGAEDTFYIEDEETFKMLK